MIRISFAADGQSFFSLHWRTGKPPASAFDAQTGELLRSVELPPNSLNPELIADGSLLVRGYRHDQGRRQDFIQAIDPATGTVQWEHPRPPVSGSLRAWSADGTVQVYVSVDFGGQVLLTVWKLGLAQPLA